MKLELFTLCDFAKGEPTGKLYVIGSFDHIFSHQAPLAAPMCAIASRLRFEAVEQGAKTITLSFVDADGGKVIPEINMQVNVQFPPGESSLAVNVVIMLPQLNLPRFGEYSIDLAVDLRAEGSIPLFVKRPPQPVAPPAVG